MKNNILIVVIVLVLAGAGVWFVRSQQNTDGAMMEGTENSSAMPVPGTTGVTEMIAEGEAREVVVEGTEFKFEPSTLTFKRGEKIRLVFRNTGKMTHDWVVDELGVRTKVIDGGTEEVLEFTPDKAGTFKYYCSVGKHRENGMEGTLTVTE